MNTSRHLRVATVTILLGLAAPAFASGSASSASSEGSSASSGSVSDSFEASSDSSKGEEKTTAGDYRVIEMAESAQRPGRLRLVLQPLAAAQAGKTFVLYVPQQTADNARIAVGETLSARTRDYGMEFAKADTGRAFYLVLEDVWYRELNARPVTL